MSTPNSSPERLMKETFARISTAQRNGMNSTDAITVGVKPTIDRLLEIEAENKRFHEALTEIRRSSSVDFASVVEWGQWARDTASESLGQ